MTFAAPRGHHEACSRTMRPTEERSVALLASIDADNVHQYGVYLLASGDVHEMTF